MARLPTDQLVGALNEHVRPAHGKWGKDGSGQLLVLLYLPGWCCVPPPAAAAVTLPTPTPACGSHPLAAPTTMTTPSHPPWACRPAADRAAGGQCCLPRARLGQGAAPLRACQGGGGVCARAEQVGSRWGGDSRAEGVGRAPQPCLLCPKRPTLVPPLLAAYLKEKEPPTRHPCARPTPAAGRTRRRWTPTDWRCS